MYSFLVSAWLLRALLSGQSLLDHYDCTAQPSVSVEKHLPRRVVMALPTGAPLWPGASGHGSSDAGTFSKSAGLVHIPGLDNRGFLLRKRHRPEDSGSSPQLTSVSPRALTNAMEDSGNSPA